MHTLQYVGDAVQYGRAIGHIWLEERDRRPANAGWTRLETP